MRASVRASCSSQVGKCKCTETNTKEGRRENYRSEKGKETCFETIMEIKLYHSNNLSAREKEEPPPKKNGHGNSILRSTFLLIFLKNAKR